MDILKASADHVRRLFAGCKPRVALVLGSGWSRLLEEGRTLGAMDYDAVPCLGSPGVEGHRGRLFWQEIDGQEHLVFEGRRHWYEGLGWEPTVFPAFLAAELGCSTLMTTCAAGAIHEGLNPGDLVVVEDHINAMGGNPLAGPPCPDLGSRFPDQALVYTPALREILIEETARLGSTAYRGVYAAVAGPTYETPAEVRALRTLGADIVGMSMVPEAMLANARGLRVAGLATVANKAGASVGHEHVLMTTQRVRPLMQGVLVGFLKRLS